MNSSCICRSTETNSFDQRLLGQHQQLALTLSLPHTEVQTFNGDPLSYCDFVRSFESLIESRTTDDNTRLNYLVQCTSGDVRELMRSCLSMKRNEGYQEARRLLKERYGQGFKIATALVDRVTKGPPIKNEALQKFSVMLTTCKNTLREIGYLNKIENPDSLHRVVERLPFPLRQRWRDIADDITFNKQREITFDDIAKFVESKARALTHPIFGNISADLKYKGKDSANNSRKISNFATCAGVEHSCGSANGGGNAFSNRTEPRKDRPKCSMCQGNHWLIRCGEFRRLSVEQRTAFVCRKGLCDNCFLSDHSVKSCPRVSFCKIPSCQVKHSTYLHPPDHGQNSAVRSDDVQPVRETNDSMQANGNASARNAYVSVA